MLSFLKIGKAKHCDSLVECLPSVHWERERGGGRGREGGKERRKEGGRAGRKKQSTIKDDFLATCTVYCARCPGDVESWLPTLIYLIMPRMKPGGLFLPFTSSEGEDYTWSWRGSAAPFR